MYSFMPTSKKRLNMSLPKDIEAALFLLAHRDNVPQATKAVELLERAMEWEEGEFKESFVKEIKKREKNHKLISAEKVFKELW